MEPSEIYVESRSRLLALAPTLAVDQLAAPLAATPPWVLVDGYRHLTGVCCNVLDGVMEGAGTSAWTAAQIECRADKSIEQICAEWADRAPDLDARVEAAGRAMSFVAFDAWTHEQDIREAAGLSGARDEIAAGLALIAIESFGKRYEASGAPALMIDLGDEEAQLGSGDARLALRTTRYELLRIIFGRRSLAQIEAADWSGTTDGSPDRDLAIEALHFFDPPPNDICD